jgi:nucleoside-diphosphate-sugar epimerase
MANVVITGGAGFLGSRLARELLAGGTLDVAGGGAVPLSRVTLVDRVPAPPDLAADERVTAVRGDLAELLDRAGGRREVLERIAGPEVSALIDWVPDPVVARIVTSWPARIRVDRAAGLGLASDLDFDSIIRLHIAESSAARP